MVGGGAPPPTTVQFHFSKGFQVNRRTVLAFLCAGALSLAGCTASAAPEPLSTPEPVAASPASSASSSTPAVDASTLRGPATAPLVPDIVPLSESFTQTLPTTVTDYENKSVTIPSAQRILALDIYGTLADTVVGLGLGDKLAGRTASNTGASLKDLPLVTAGAHELNAEAILAMRPDVVLADSTIGPPEVLAQIAAAGIPVVSFTPDRSVTGITQMVTDVALALGVPEAGVALNQQIAGELASTRTAIAGLSSGTSSPLRTAMLYVRGTAGVFFIMGPGTGAEDLLHELGLHDVAAEAGLKGSRPANAESLAALDPQVYLMMSDGLESAGGIDGLLKRPGVANTAAGQHRRIIDAPDGQLLSYGPNTPAALLALAKTVYTQGSK